MTDQPGNFPGTGEPPPPPQNPYGSPPPAEGYPPPVPPPPPAESYQAPAPPPPPAGYAPPAQESAFAPPPAAPQPAGAHQQQWQQGAANLQNFDPKSVNTMDWGIIGAGLFALIFSFFGYYNYTVSASAFGISRTASKSYSAWHGFFGWFGAFVAFAVAVVLALHLIAKIELPFPVRLTVLGGFALSLLCVLLALVIVPGVEGSAAAAAAGIDINKGHGIGYWLSLIVILGGAVLSFMRFQQTGGKLPGKA